MRHLNAQTLFIEELKKCKECKIYFAERYFFVFLQDKMYKEQALSSIQTHVYLLWLVLFSTNKTIVYRGQNAESISRFLNEFVEKYDGLEMPDSLTFAKRNRNHIRFNNGNHIVMCDNDAALKGRTIDVLVLDDDIGAAEYRCMISPIGHMVRLVL